MFAPDPYMFAGLYRTALKTTGSQRSWAEVIYKILVCSKTRSELRVSASQSWRHRFPIHFFQNPYQNSGKDFEKNE